MIGTSGRDCWLNLDKYTSELIVCCEVTSEPLKCIFPSRDFTGNALTLISRQAWEAYPWAEKLDLSYNKIEVVEARAFQNLPFLETINLEGNSITEIRSDTFRAWHGMQFLQTLVLSRNPLSVIEDPWFFRLPSLTHLDLSATRVTRQTLLVLLLRTSRLETLKLSKNTACCLCQHKHSTKTPCRTLSFDCTSVCGTSAPRCAPLAETTGLQTGPVPPREGNSSPVLNLQPKEPSPREQRTVTLTVVLSQSSPDASAPTPQQLSRQEGNAAKELTLMLQSVQHRGWSSDIDTRRFYFLAEGLVAQLKNKLYKAMNILTLKSPRATQAAPRDERQEVSAGEGRPISREQQEPGLDLTRSEAILLEAIRRMTLSNILAVSSHQRAPTPPAAQLPTRYPTEASHLTQSGHGQDHSDAVQQTNAANRMEDDYEEEEASPTQDSAETDEEQEQEDSDGTAGSEVEEEELKEQAPPVSTVPGSSSSPGSAPTQGALFGKLLSLHLRSLVPERALRGFMARVARALRGDCGLPQLQSACAEMVSRTGLLLKLLSETQPNPEPSDLLEQCTREVDAGTSRSHAQVQAREMDIDSAETEMHEHAFFRVWLLVLSLTTLITVITSIALLVQCCFMVCARKRAKDSQGSTKCHLKGCFQNLCPKWRSRSKDTDGEKEARSEAGASFETHPLLTSSIPALQQAALAQPSQSSEDLSSGYELLI